MSGLTTHVLDTVKGIGASGMRVRLDGPSGTAVAILDAGGRALLCKTLRAGFHELQFDAGDYLGRDAFYDIITIRFRLDAPQTHYHIPLILSAFGYSTYRGG